MHFVLVVLAGNRGGVFFFSPWVSDLCVLISGSAFATHGAYENTAGAVPGFAVLTFLQE